MFIRKNMQMNKIDIQPKFVKGLACYEGALVAIAAARNLEYQIALSHTFCFAYMSQKTATIGEKIATSNADFDDRIKKYCGIEMVPVSYKGDINEIVKTMISNNCIVGVESNVYYCPWSFEYQKSNHGHHYLVVDYDDNGYKCIDTTMYENYYNIDYDTFSQGFKQLNEFKVSKIEGNVNYRSILEESILSIINSTCLEDLQRFYSDFKDIDYEREFSSLENGHWGCALQRNIGFYLVGSMALYSEFISFISKKIPNLYLNCLNNEINEIKNKWNTLYNLILKVYYSRNNSVYREKANDCLDNIIDKYHYVIKTLIAHIL